MTDRYAVVGNPVCHSLSPRIHAAFAAATGQALRYDTLLAPTDRFAETVEGFFAGGGAGLNVTVPFKEQAARWVSELAPAARAAGAVNTIVPRPDGFAGFNTDGDGLVRDLVANCGLELAGRRVLLVGAGGAARGVLRPLLAQAPARLVVANRTPERAVELVGSLADEPGAEAVSAAALYEVAGGFDLVINATSAGLEGRDAGLSPGPVRGAFCYDMMYPPPDAAGRVAAGETAFCRWAAAHGAGRVVDGLGMLVEQAALAFALWRHVVPDTAPVLELLRGTRL